MSKHWYYELMGSALGPISSADLRVKVQQGQILPETRVRLGEDGKWQTADRVKGLLDAPPPPPVVPTPVAPTPAAAPPAPAPKKFSGMKIVTEPAPATMRLSDDAATSTVSGAAAMASGGQQTSATAGGQVTSAGATSGAAPATELRMALAGDAAVGNASAPSESTEYDFFRFVGFEQALGTALHTALSAYCQQQHLTLTQATRRAIAHFVNRRDLSGEAPPSPPQPPSAETDPAVM